MYNFFAKFLLELLKDGTCDSLAQNSIHTYDWFTYNLLSSMCVNLNVIYIAFISCRYDSNYIKRGASLWDLLSDIRVDLP